MAYKTTVPEAPPSTNEPPKPGGAPKDPTPAVAASRDNLRKGEVAAHTEEYGYIVTNQRYHTLTASTNHKTGCV